MRQEHTSQQGSPVEGIPDLDRLAIAVEALIRAESARAFGAANGHGGQPVTALTFQQTARALSFALAEFADGGTPASRPVAARSGLAGSIVQAGTRARATRDLIADRRFRLVFQPVVGLRDRRIHHFEALFRPVHGPGTPVCSTQEFVTFSEAMGLSEELDSAVLERAVAVLANAPGPPVAVNVSGLSMQSPSFCERMLRLAATRPGRFLIELTETAEIEDVAGAAATLDRLRAAGIPVCLDDFGAGAAAFRYLRDFRVDYLKIDGRYVQGAPLDPQDRSFVASMVELARSSDVRVIAEMIETEEQARLMQEMGVDLGQGWLFGQGGALPATEGSARN
jgi:EAL domain-containing protein (putative c-di-GMP-specific phosphodiesterase class I)